MNKSTEILIHANQDLAKKLEELLRLNKLDDSDITILKKIAEKSDSKELSNGNTQDGTSQGFKPNEDQSKETNQSGMSLSSFLIEKIKSGEINFCIFGTNGEKPTHETQYSSFEMRKPITKVRKFTCLDSDENIPNIFVDDTDKVWVSLKKDYELPEYKILALRVADRRIDHRKKSHTTVGIFVSNKTDRSMIESLVKDVNGLKILMKAVFEKSNSSLKGAEKDIKQGFLV